MPVQEISAEALKAALSPGRRDQLRAWCAALEAGAVLYFPETPLPIPPADLDLLLGSRQTGSKVHKNIAYKPVRDELSGLDSASVDPALLRQLHDAMRRYSRSVTSFLAEFLAPYTQRWTLDYASFRPIEEQGRDLPLRRRNDLLHTDAFPTRPTHGWRILRFFHNIHPTRTRDWVVGEPFARLVDQFTPGKLPLPRPDTAMSRAGRELATSAGLGKILPALKRTPYDEFMMRLHNAMKEDALFQQSCRREQVHFGPGSSWMVYTETVPHAVLAGQYALEQTFLVDPAAMVTPETAPVRVLEKMAGAPLV